MSAPALSQEERATVARFGLLEREPVEQIHLDAEYVRSRLSPQPVEGMLKTPDEMIEDLEWAKYATGRIALVIKQADSTRRAAKRAFDLAHSKALRVATGKSAELREAEAIEAADEERAAWDRSEVAYDFAKGVARSVEGSASMTQTQASLVKAQMSLAGTGRES